MRRREAKRLRAHPDQASRSGDDLLRALKAEMERNPGGWETQYHLIMALAAGRHKRAVEDLHQLLDTPALEPMVRVAVGDALVRLSDDPSSTMLSLVRSRDVDLQHGALRAAADTRLGPTPAVADEILDQAPWGEADTEDEVLFHLVFASTYWPEPARTQVQDLMRDSQWDALQDAASAARSGDVDVDML